VRRAAKAVVGVAAVLLAMCGGARAQLSAADQELIQAVEGGHNVQRAQEALRKHANANLVAKDLNGESLLTYSIHITGSFDMVKLLLDNHANPNAKNYVGETPLIAAIREFGSRKKYSRYDDPSSITRAFDIVKLLLDSGANVDKASGVGSDYGTTPLMLAAKNGFSNIVRLLLEHHALVDAKDEFGDTAFDEALCNPELPNAGRPEQLETAQILLDNHADIEVINKDGYTPLLSLVQHIDFGGRSVNLGYVKFLLDHHANTEAATKDGVTALLMGVEGRNTDVVKLLLQYHANVEARDTRGNHTYTPLLIAVGFLLSGDSQTQADIVKLLLGAHANLEARNDYDETALTEAVGESSPDIVKLLLDSHADIEAKDKGGNTPLLSAAAHGRTDNVKLLLAYHANEAARTPGPDSLDALGVAARSLECETVVQLEHGSHLKALACIQALAVDYQAKPSDHSWEKAVNAGLALKPMPTVVPQEARRSFVQANDVFKNSQGDADAQKAIALYKQALVQAPWFPEAWNNLSLAQEKVGDYKGAASSLKNFTLVHPEAANDQATLDHIYLLEGKAK